MICQTPSLRKQPKFRDATGGFPSKRRLPNGHRNTTISALVSQTSFRGETIDGVAKCRLFSQAIKHQATIVFFRCSLLGSWVLHERQRGEIPVLKLKGVYCSVFCTNYRKIPKISPGAYIFQRPFLRGLYSEGLIYGGKFAFQNQLG